MKAQIIEQVELFSEAELESLEFVPEELEAAIEAERVPDLESISFEDVAEKMEASLASESTPVDKILILSGHGLRCKDQTFPVPRGFTVNFFTREGTTIRDSVAGRIEQNPDQISALSPIINQIGRVYKDALCPDYYLIDPMLPPQLTINAVPHGYNQFIPQPGQTIKLSQILSLPWIQNLGTPLKVYWCACRANEPERTWQQSIQRSRTSRFQKGSKPNTNGRKGRKNNSGAVTNKRRRP